MSLSIDFNDRVAVVTGSAGGIGREIGRTLLEGGARVAFADIAPVDMEGDDGRAIAVRLDVTDPESARAGLAEVTERLGPIDVLVNNAGMAAKRQGMPFTNQERSDWEPVLTVNAIGTFVVSREFVLGRDADRPGVIVNLSSVAGRMGSQTDPSYSAAKAAVINLTQCMAKDLAPVVRVCAVCPGMVRTPFYEAQYRAAAARDPEVAKLTAEEYFDDKARKLIPLGVGQRARDIAEAVAFLASDLAACITGQTVNVDGGLVMS
jgi:NAD(P)-dependent dehydrogenase (short-subunit alcohol dehydrogenase family)